MADRACDIDELGEVLVELVDFELHSGLSVLPMAVAAIVLSLSVDSGEQKLKISSGVSESTGTARVQKASKLGQDILTD